MENVDFKGREKRLKDLQVFLRTGPSRGLQHFAHMPSL